MIYQQILSGEINLKFAIERYIWVSKRHVTYFVYVVRPAEIAWTSGSYLN